MAAKTITPEQKRAQEKQTVGLMIALYCHGNHGTPKGTLCPDCAALQEYAVIYALTKGGPGDALMSLSLTAYQQGFKFQKFGAALPYILILWLIINVVAKEIVKRQRAAQKQAAGLDE